jgi:hypothetical protein
MRILTLKLDILNHWEPICQSDKEERDLRVRQLLTDYAEIIKFR